MAWCMSQHSFLTVNLQVLITLYATYTTYKLYLTYTYISLILTGKDIKVDDILWSVGPYVIGTKQLEKVDWDKFVEYIRSSKRPVKIIWRRVKPVGESILSSRSNDDPFNVAGVNKPINLQPVTFSADSSDDSPTVTSPKVNSDGGLHATDESDERQQLIEIASRYLSTYLYTPTP